MLATTQKGACQPLDRDRAARTWLHRDKGTLSKILTAAAIGFLAGWQVAAYLMEYLDNSFKNSDEVQQKLGLPRLAAVPVVDGDGRQSQIVMMNDVHSGAAEAFRGAAHKPAVLPL